MLAPTVSADVRYVLFHSDGGLVPQDTNNRADLYVHDRVTGVTRLVSHAYDGSLGNSDAFFGTLSPDGTHVAFQGFSTNLIPGGSAGGSIFVRDLVADQIEQVAGGSEPALSFDGRHVA